MKYKLNSKINKMTILLGIVKIGMGMEMEMKMKMRK